MLVSIEKQLTDTIRLFREAVYKQAHTERKMCNLKNGIELDESYFGPKRVRERGVEEQEEKLLCLACSRETELFIHKLFLESREKK